MLRDYTDRVYNLEVCNITTILSITLGQKMLFSPFADKECDQGLLTTQ